MALIDQGGAIRHGEELDIQKVDAWLRPYLPDLAEAYPSLRNMQVAHRIGRIV
jgi:hypothetical protein